MPKITELVNGARIPIRDGYEFLGAWIFWGFLEEKEYIIKKTKLGVKVKTYLEQERKS